MGVCLARKYQTNAVAYDRKSIYSTSPWLSFQVSKKGKNVETMWEQ